MKCKEVYLYICDNLDANLNSAKCRAVRKHLATCSDCTSYLDSVKKTVSLYRSAPSPKVPAAAHERLFRTIDLTWKSHRKSRQRSS